MNMIGKTTDRRIGKTMKAISDALAELLTEKELHRISINEIAEKAEVSRTTFYKYYSDVYDLYDKLSQNTLNDLGIIFLQNRERSEEEFYQEFIRYVADNRMTFRMIFSRNTTAGLKDRVVKMIEGVLRHQYSEKYEVPLNSLELIYYTGYRANGLMSVLQKWVRTDFRESCEYMAEVIAILDKNMENSFRRELEKLHENLGKWCINRENKTTYVRN